MNNPGLPFHSIPDAPAAVSAGAVLGRLVDGIGFRFRWATEGLADGSLAFKPAPDCMSLGELLDHVMELLAWVAAGVGVQAPAEGAGPVCERVLVLAAALGARFKAMTDDEVARCTIRSSRGDTRPVWNMVNGPLSDSLTHVGQILSWRRISGAPAVPADVFRGLPPKA